MAEVGMDVDVVRQIGKSLGSASNDLASTMGKINSLLSQAQASWKGKDSKHFQDLWQSQYSGQLKKIIQEIADLGTAAGRNADEQDRISNNY
jgi:uncharacterized protein YukE